MPSGAALFNFREEEQEVSCILEEVEQLAGKTAGIRKAAELWSGTDREIAEGVLTDTVPAHGARLFMLSEP